MDVSLESLARWGALGIAAAGWVALLVGIFSAASPARSIALYEWIMERFNWRVRPIDERRELRTTRVFGLLLTVLSLAALWPR